MRLIGLATTFPKQTSCLLRTLIKNRGEYHSLTRIDVQQRPQRPVRYKSVPQMTQSRARLLLSLPRCATPEQANAGVVRSRFFDSCITKKTHIRVRRRVIPGRSARAAMRHTRTGTLRKLCQIPRRAFREPRMVGLVRRAEASARLYRQADASGRCGDELSATARCPDACRTPAAAWPPACFRFPKGNRVLSRTCFRTRRTHRY